MLSESKISRTVLLDGHGLVGRDHGQARNRRDRVRDIVQGLKEDGLVDGVDQPRVDER